MWSNPRYHRSQHHPNQRFFLGDPVSITRSGFTISFSESASWNMSKSRHPYHFSTFTRTSLIIESDQILSFLIETWCDPKFFSSGPSLVHHIWPVEDTHENRIDKIGHFGPLRVILGLELLILRVNITSWHQFLSYPTLISSFQRTLIFLGRFSSTHTIETIRRS